MTWDTAFSQFGGLFGLCLGGSVISFVELFYAFTFKFWEYLQISKTYKKSVESHPIYVVSNRRHLNHIPKFKYNENPFLYGN